MKCFILTISMDKLSLYLFFYLFSGAIIKLIHELIINVSKNVLTILLLCHFLYRKYKLQTPSLFKLLGGTTITFVMIG